MERDGGQGENQRVDFAAVRGEHGGEQLLLVARPEGRSGGLRVGKRKEEKKAGEKRRRSSWTIEDGGQVQGRGSVGFGGNESG